MPAAKDTRAEVKTAAYAIGGIVEALTLQPVDTVKTRMQLDTTGASRSLIGTGAQIIKSEGVGALWKGLLPFTGHLLFKNICRMGTYATLQQAFRDENGELGTARQMGAGLCAGMIEAVLVVTPFELVKTRLQEQKGASTANHKYKGTVHATKTIVAEEGFAGLWKGISPTMVRNGVNQMVLFFAKENTDKLLWNKKVGDGKELAAYQSFISGAVAGGVGPLVSAPMDIIKTRFQSSTGPSYPNLFVAMGRIASQEGVTVLWRGLLPRVIRLAMGQAVTWTVTDKLIHFLDQK